jgi:DNA mismatch endonuclease (patch repair protein)
MPKFNVAIFVHGCFWHRHIGCKYATTPLSNAAKWDRKFKKNIERDALQTAALRAAGWRVIIVWECELKADSHHRLERLLDEINQKESPSGIQ